MARTHRLRPQAPRVDVPIRPAENRRALFWRQLRLHAFEMILPSLLAFVFFFPAVYWTEKAVLSLPEDWMHNGLFSAAQYFSSYILVLCALLAITGPVLTGLSLLCRNWARGTPCSRWSCVFGGIKRNWKQGLLNSLLNSLMLLAGYGILSYYGAKCDESNWYLIPFALGGAILLIWILMQQTIYTLLCTYALPYRKLLKNAFALCFLSMPKALLTLLIHAIPLLVTLLLCAVMPLRAGLFVLLLLCYYAFFGITLERFVSASYANAVCQKRVDSRIDGARIDIGLVSERTVDLAREAAEAKAQKEAAQTDAAETDAAKTDASETDALKYPAED